MDISTTFKKNEAKSWQSLVEVFQNLAEVVALVAKLVGEKDFSDRNSVAHFRLP
jgi:hypothetical protein